MVTGKYTINLQDPRPLATVDDHRKVMEEEEVSEEEDDVLLEFFYLRERESWLL